MVKKSAKKSEALDKLKNVVSEIEQVSNITDGKEPELPDIPDTPHSLTESFMENNSHMDSDTDEIPVESDELKATQKGLEIDEDHKLFWSISNLSNWKENPRRITHVNYMRVKKQIQELGEYKPLIVNSGKYYGRKGETLGGNTRLHVYIDDLHWKRAWVSIVNPRNFKEALAYALSDNDHAGDYVEEELEELVSQANFSQDELRMFKVDMKEGIDLEKLLNDGAVDPKSLQYQSEFQVVVDCQNEIEQQEVYEKLTGLGLKAKVLTL